MIIHILTDSLGNIFVCFKKFMEILRKGKYFSEDVEIDLEIQSGTDKLMAAFVSWVDCP